ncbi:class D beta-lactamase [Maribacter sp. R86514]|uniref:class D beta-lactamase n=1 Tax=Maribacter sp. R86514 TaxID=3093854 RepID=UPI0037C98D21
MKIGILLFLIVCIASCKDQKNTSLLDESKSNSTKINKFEFQTIIDSNNVKGSVLIYDSYNNTYYSNDFEWATHGNLPASTFKITNSIIGLETGVIESDSTIFKWDGKEKWSNFWEQDLVLRDAFQFSCVPCYQEVAAKIGVQRMNEYVENLQYGNLKINADNITDFWLEGDSRISQMQQIDFLKRYFNDQLPISKRTKNIMQDVMLNEKTTDYKLSGKTGLSNTNNQYNGWFIGFIEVKNHVYFFATNLEPIDNNIDLNNFIKTRKEVTLAALKELQVIK